MATNTVSVWFDPWHPLDHEISAYFNRHDRHVPIQVWMDYVAAVRTVNTLHNIMYKCSGRHDG